MLNLPRGIHISILITAGILLFFPFLGSVHLFDWDEINFAECAREMIVTGDYSNVKINFQPFWEKPPLFIWMQALSMKLFGINEFAARLPNALCGITTLLVVYALGSRIYDRRFGFLWALAYLGSLLPFLYFKSGIIDPWFNLFIFCGIYQAVLHTNNPSGRQGTRTAMLSALFIGLATLTKGPVAALIFGLCALVYWARKRFTAATSLKHLFIFAGVFILTAGSWFLYEIATGHLQVVKDFFVYQVRLFKTEDAGHGGFFGYHFVVLFFGCFPASLFAIRAWKRSSSDTPFQVHFKKWMNTMFWVVLLLFSIVETKIVHYSSLCYFPLTFLCAYSLHKLLAGEFAWKRWMTIALATVIVILGLIFILVPFIDHFKPFFNEPGRIKDRFALDCLNTPVKWGGWEWIPGAVFLALSLFFVSGMARGKIKMALPLFALTALTLFCAMAFITPKIEQYSQGPAIEFYKAVKDQKAHLETINFKSYAYLFYGGKVPEQNTPDLVKYAKGKMESDERTGQTVFRFELYASNYMRVYAADRPIFMVVKTNDAENFVSENPLFRELYRKGGYVFFHKEAAKASWIRTAS